MHEMQTIVTDVRVVDLSVRLSLTRLKSTAARAVYAACRGHSMQPLSSYCDHLFMRCRLLLPIHVVQLGFIVSKRLNRSRSCLG